MEFSLMTDAKQIMIQVLGQFGLKPTGTTTQQIFMDYFNLKHKLIRQQPREVLISPVVEAKAKALGLDVVLNVIVKKFKSGEDVNPFLSKGIYRLNDHDYLLNSWEMHHLHLNTEKKYPGDYFNDRANDLLFVHVTPECVYLIDIRPHRENYVFAQKDLLRVIRDTWPDLNRKFLVKDEPMNIKPSFDEKDTTIMRKKGYHFFTQVDQLVYAPGIGSACSGFSMLAGMEMNKFHRNLYKIHCFTQQFDEELKTMFSSEPGRQLSKLHITLWYRDWLFWPYEMNSQQFLNIDLSNYQPDYA